MFIDEIDNHGNNDEGDLIIDDSVIDEILNKTEMSDTATVCRRALGMVIDENQEPISNDDSLI